MIDDDDALLLSEIMNCMREKGKEERERERALMIAKLMLSTEGEHCMYDMISGS